jgi:PAS domain-containing protein
MIGCNTLRITALARSVFGIPPVLAMSIAPTSALAQGADSGITMTFVWVEIFSALILLFSGIAIWAIARNQTKRIRELKREAEKLRDADFGEPLRVRAGELGELAAVFNDMRDKLKATTLSRDYVDSILSSMNDAIIVTASDGTIKRVNKATSHMLGYEARELVGTTIDFIVNTRRRVDPGFLHLLFSRRQGSGIRRSDLRGTKHHRAPPGRKTHSLPRPHRCPDEDSQSHAVSASSATLHCAGAPQHQTPVPVLHRYRLFQGNQRHLRASRG